MLLLTPFGWLPSIVQAQPSATFQQYFYYADNVVTIAPIVGYQFNNSLYLEGRYNYEDLNTFSFYAGKTFGNDAALTYTFTPMLGGVLGNYKGASLGANFSLEYKRFYFSSQPQYTLSRAGRENHFFYNWADLSCEVFKGFSLGISTQYTQAFQSSGLLEKGLFMEVAFKKWALPVYLFNPQADERYFLFGLTYEWEGKKRKKTPEEPMPTPFPADSSAAVLAAKPKETSFSENRNQVIASAVPNKSGGSDQREQATGANIPGYVVNSIAPVQRQDPAGSLFALTIGNYNDIDQANAIKANVLSSGKQAIVYAEGTNYKIRMTGFVNRNEAESFKTKFSKAAGIDESQIQAYQVKSLQLELVEKSKRM